MSMPIAAAGRRTRGRTIALFVSLAAAVVGASGSPAAMQPAGVARAVPALGTALEQSLARRESHEWQMELGADEFVAISVEPLAPAEADDWPLVALIAPGGEMVSERTEPTVAASIDSWAVTVVSYGSDRAGPYRVRVATRASPVRYRLRLDHHRRAVEQDRRRIDAHRLLGEGMHLYVGGSPDQLRGSVEKFEQALTILVGIEDREGEAITLGSISAARYRLSDAPRGTVATTRALDIWKQ